MYGLLTPLDGQKLTRCLHDLVRRQPDRPIDVLEIGVRDGATARGMRTVLTEQGRTLRYTGIDNARDLGQVLAPFSEARIILGDSAAVTTVQQLPAPPCMDLVLLDGCHCRTHVRSDVLHYRPYLRPGGYLLLHDAAPGMQGRDFQGHGDPGNPDDYVAVRAALKDLYDEDHPVLWNLKSEAEAYDDPTWGGMLVFHDTRETEASQ